MKASLNQAGQVLTTLTNASDKQAQRLIENGDLLKMLMWSTAGVDRKAVFEALGLGPADKMEQTMDNLKAMEIASRIMGRNYFGPQQVMQAFDFNLPLVDIPPFCFSERDLKTAKRLNQLLVLRVDEIDGRSITCHTIFGVGEHTGRPDYLMTHTPRRGWALISHGVLGGSTQMNLLSQTDYLVSYIRDQVFESCRVPPVYQQALDEYETKRPGLQDLVPVDADRRNTDAEAKVFFRAFGPLGINALVRPQPVETVYDDFLYRKITGHVLRSRRSGWVWTSYLTESGLLAVEEDCRGMGIMLPFYSGPESSLGVYFSRYD